MLLGSVAEAATYKTTDPLKVREGATTDIPKLDHCIMIRLLKKNRLKVIEQQ